MWWGDSVKDDNGCRAVFADQGAEASPMAAATFQDTLSRLPGMVCETNDAAPACTQVHRTEAPRLLRESEKECPQLWIRLPHRQRPKKRDPIAEPVVPNERNLYGHPLAGLLWEESSCQLGSVFIYVHQTSQLFLSGRNTVENSSRRNRSGRAPLLNPVFVACTQRKRTKS